MTRINKVWDITYKYTRALYHLGKIYDLRYFFSEKVLFYLSQSSQSFMTEVSERGVTRKSFVL